MSEIKISGIITLAVKLASLLTKKLDQLNVTFINCAYKTIVTSVCCVLDVSKYQKCKHCTLQRDVKASVLIG